MIGYVLLVTTAVVMGILVYNWLKPYVPTEPLKCPDEVSIFIQDYSCGETELNLTLKNNGLFDIGGYFIHATNDPNQELATIDLSQNLTNGGIIASNAVVFMSGSTNDMKPNQIKEGKFDLDEKIYLLEIIPIRWQVEEGKKRFVVCSDAKIREDVDCDSGGGNGSH